MVLDGLEVHDVGEDHMDMFLEPNVQSTAAKLNNYLSAVLKSTSERAAPQAAHATSRIVEPILGTVMRMAP